MLVSHQKKFIFLKTIKTAGTSVESYFERFCRDDGGPETHFTPERVSRAGIVGLRGDVPPGTAFYNHMPAVEIREKLGDRVWQDYTKFTIVRNPFDKVVSGFWFFHGREENLGQDEEVHRKFRTYVLEGNLFLDSHIYTIDGALCDAIYMRYENIIEDLRMVCHKLAVPFEPERLPKFKSEYRPKQTVTKDYFDRETVNRVRSVYHREFEWFGYSQDLERC